MRGERHPCRSPPSFLKASIAHRTVSASPFSPRKLLWDSLQAGEIRHRAIGVFAEDFIWEKKLYGEGVRLALEMIRAEEGVIGQERKGQAAVQEEMADFVSQREGEKFFIQIVGKAYAGNTAGRHRIALGAAQMRMENGDAQFRRQAERVPRSVLAGKAVCKSFGVHRRLIYGTFSE